MWTALQIVFVALGLLLVFGGNQLARPVLIYAGIGCLGLAAIATGSEAIITRRLVLRRRRGYQRAYFGIPAIFQGIQFNLIGLYFLGVAFMMYFNNAQEVMRQMARRPAVLLFLLGGFCLLQALIMLWGSGATRERSQGLVILELLVGRLFPGTIWLILALGLIALGLLDAFAPMRFDEMGGRFLEQLYGVR